MNIIILIPTLAGGGAERIVSEISCNLSEIKQTIVLFENNISYPYKGDLLTLNTHNSRNLFIKSINLFRKIIRFRKIVNKFKPDVVMSFMEGANIVNLLVKLLSFKSKHMSIISVRVTNSKFEPMMHGLYGFVYRIMIYILYNRANKIVAVSQGVKEDLIINFKINPVKIAVINNPVNIGKIETLSRENLEHHWFHEDTPIIINVGRLSKQKNHCDLLKAFSELRKEKLCRLVIIGEGELKYDLLDLAKFLKIEADVLFLGFQKNPFKFMAHSTVFALPSIFEGFPNALVEAMAAGCPVVASDCQAGPREILAPDMPTGEDIKWTKDAIYGLLVPVGNVNALIDALKRLLSNKELRKYYSKQGLERVRDFEIEKIIGKYLEVCRE